MERARKGFVDVRSSGKFSAAGSESSQVFSETSSNRDCSLVLTWGNGEEGQLGHGKNSNNLTPVVLDVLKNKVVRLIACGGVHTAVLLENGDVYTWGLGEDGQLGHGHKLNDEKPSNESRPRLVEALQGLSIKEIACGGAHTAALTDTGEMYTWGRGNEFQLGHPDGDSHYEPHKVDFFNCLKVVHIGCGFEHSAALTENGSVYSWGKGDKGQLGHGTDQDQRLPTLVEGLEDVGTVKLVCGVYITAALTENGELYIWGLVVSPAGVETMQTTPRIMEGLHGRDVRHICCGGYHAAVVAGNGEVYTWGLGLRASRHGQLGRGDDPDLFVPKPIKVLKGKDVRHVACGWEHTLCVTASGQVYAWGRGASGRLGLGDEASTNVPRLVEALTGNNVRQISCGYYHSAAAAAVRQSHPTGVPKSDSASTTKSRHSDNNDPDALPLHPLSSASLTFSSTQAPDSLSSASSPTPASAASGKSLPSPQSQSQLQSPQSYQQAQAQAQAQSQSQQNLSHRRKTTPLSVAWDGASHTDENCATSPPQPTQPPPAAFRSPEALSSASTTRSNRSAGSSNSHSGTQTFVDVWELFQRRMKELEEALPFSYAKLQPTWDMLRKKLHEEAVGKQKLQLELLAAQDNKLALERKLHEERQRREDLERAPMNVDGRRLVQLERQLGEETVMRQELERLLTQEQASNRDLRGMLQAMQREHERMNVREDTLRQKYVQLEEELAILKDNVYARVR